jgi:molybdate transport system substrate-binding protein
MKKSMILLSLCLFFSGSAWASISPPITVFAASSLTNAMQTISQAYQLKTGIIIRVSLASSSTLARQIAQGAPADIYISADNRWMNYVEQQGVIDKSSRQALLTNSLVLVAPINAKENLVEIAPNWSLKTLLDGTRLAMGNPAYVPAGIYAQQSLQKLGVWASTVAYLAPTNNVRSALMLVEHGESQLGIVYKTDALIAKNVKIVAQLPNDSHAPIEYPMAMIKGRNSEAVNHFYQYLQSSAAKSVFVQYGFGVK